jgi:hypothetical protein
MLRRLGLLLLLCAIGWGQTVAPPAASFTGIIKHIDSKTLILSRTDTEDMEFDCTHKTHYYSGDKKIKASQIKVGDRVSVDSTLNLYLKPEAVNVRVLPPAKPATQQ